MPVFRARLVDGQPEITWAFPQWSWAPMKGTPAQFYGEPQPSPGWFFCQIHDLLGYRSVKQYAQADAIKQWLIDYGCEVECEKDGSIRVKY